MYFDNKTIVPCIVIKNEEQDVFVWRYLITYKYISLAIRRRPIFIYPYYIYLNLLPVISTSNNLYKDNYKVVKYRYDDIQKLDTKLKQVDCNVMYQEVNKMTY